MRFKLKMANDGRRLSANFWRNNSILTSNHSGSSGFMTGTGCGWNRRWVGTDQVEVFGGIGTLTRGYLMLAFFCNSPTIRCSWWRLRCINVSMCYAHPPRVRIAICISIIGNIDILDLSSVTQVLISVFDKFSDWFRIPNSENDAWPRFSKDWLQLNKVREDTVWVGSRIGGERTVWLFFFPKFVSNIVNLILKKNRKFRPFPSHSILPLNSDFFRLWVPLTAITALPELHSNLIFLASVALSNRLISKPLSLFVALSNPVYNTLLRLQLL